MSKHERAASDRDDAADRIDEATALRTDSSDDSVDVGTVIGARLVPELDDGVDSAERARVFEALFQVPARPQTLGRYVVLSTLGRGGMGTVLEAFDRTLDRKVAVKVLHEELDDDHATRLLREAQAMAKLSHPNVVQVYEADTVGGQTFVVMELVQGQTLEAWIKQDSPPGWRECVEVFIEAGQGLAAAHAEGLVHRDFKPSNAIVDDKGRARVLDFGLARQAEVCPTEDVGLGRAGGKAKGDPPQDPLALESAASPMMGTRTMQTRGDDEPTTDLALTKPGTVLGTPAYMPPEQMKGQEADARSDQFSFCVSLFEAVYGERPFEGGTMAARIVSMMRGDVRPAPKGSAVPARLRTALLRGLAVDPDARWPSMEALLHQLRALVAPRTRRWMALGVTAGLTALGGGLALGQYVQVKDRCTGAQTQMDGIWDDDRRQQVRTALLGTERSLAPGTWARIEPQLNAYADAWVDAHTEACEATSVRGEQSNEALDLRMRCLGQRRTSLRATVDVLVDAGADANTDATVVEHAVELVSRLPTLTRCEDLSWLEQQDQLVPPPEDPDVAAAVQDLRARLADVGAMLEAGRYAGALEVVEPVVQQAEALGYPPLVAEALYRRGQLRQHDGQYAEAEQDLRQAHTLAVEHRHDSIALHTAQLLTYVVGYRLARHAEGLQWGQMEALPLAQRSGEPLQEAKSLGNLGNVFRKHGDYDNARLHHQRALALKEEALGQDHPDVAMSLNNLGNVASSQGDLDDARVYHQRALAIWEKTLGRDHPDVAMSLNNLGAVLASQGELEQARVHYQRALAIKQNALGADHPGVARSLGNLGIVSLDLGEREQARVHHQRALAIFERALGPDHPHVAMSLNNLGNVFDSLGKLDEAMAHHRRALAIFEQALGTDHPQVAMSLDNLGRVFARQGELQEAMAHHQRALAIRDEALGPDHPHRAESLASLGDVFDRLGELDDARLHYQRALTIFEQALGPDHPHVAHSLVGLATVALQTSDPGPARAHAERAVSIRERTTVEPRLLAGARFVLARALWRERDQRARARALAEQARDALTAAEGPGDSTVDLAQVETWLATHRAP